MNSSLETPNEVAVSARRMARRPPGESRARGLGKLVAGRIAWGLGAMLGDRSAGRLGILVYHRVEPVVRHLSQPAFNVPPRRFDEQLTGLLARGYTPISLARALQAHQRGETVPPRSFVVTFDDGFGSVHAHAWPVLLRLGVPATVFLATAFLDSIDPFPFDPWGQTYRDRLPVDAYRPLALAECHAMAADGLIEFGAHTHTHADFRNRPEDFGRDLAISVDAVRSHFAMDEVTFAFPFGRRSFGFASDEMIAAARECGVNCALSTESELVAPASDPFSWGRLHAYGCDTSGMLAAKLAGWFNWAPKLQELSSRRSRCAAN